MLIMPDIEDPFVPLSEGLFVDPYEARLVSFPFLTRGYLLLRSNITGLLSQLPALFSQIKNPEPALLPTLNAALAALEKTGGKIVCSLSALPTWGPGRLFLRDDGKQHGGDAEKKLFNTEHPGWRKTAEKMVAAGVGVDFFLAAPGGGYLDIATIGEPIHSAISYRTKIFRSCVCFDWRRDFLLSQFCCTARQREATPRNCPYCHARDWISSAYESALLEWSPSCCLPRQLYPAQLRS